LDSREGLGMQGRINPQAADDLEFQL